MLNKIKQVGYRDIQEAILDYLDWYSRDNVYLPELEAVKTAVGNSLEGVDSVISISFWNFIESKIK